MEKLTFGILVSLLGMAIVFFGLVTLMCLIKVLVTATSGIGKEKKAVRKSEPEVTTVSEKDVPEVSSATDDSATVAAIMAAISCMLGDNNSFKVRHIRRITR